MKAVKLKLLPMQVHACGRFDVDGVGCSQECGEQDAMAMKDMIWKEEFFRMWDERAHSVFY